VDSPEVRWLYKFCPEAFFQTVLVNGQFIPNPITSTQLKFTVAVLKTQRMMMQSASDADPAIGVHNGDSHGSEDLGEQNNRSKPRRKIMAEHIKRVAEFGDPVKVTALFLAFDAAGIALPRRRGVGARNGLWSQVSQSLRKKILVDLRRDFYRMNSSRRVTTD
jgi:hypothetical protein